MYNKFVIIGGLVLVFIIGGFAMSLKRPAGEPIPASINGESGSSAVREVTVLGSNFAFAPSVITVNQGEKIRLIFKNTGGNHDWRVDELSVATKVIRGGEQDIVEFIPDKKGTFEFYCSVGAHRQMGMKGTITVQ
jgi:plastocyanin